MPTSPDAPGLHTLMEAYLDGDQAAFAALHRRLGPKLRARALQIVKNPALVDDAVQLTFMRAHEARRRFSVDGRRNPDRAVDNWYQAIARNVAVDLVRRAERRRRRDSAVALDPSGGMCQPRGPESPEELHLSRESAVAAREAIHRAVGRLPPQQAEVIRMHKLAERSMDDVALELQVRTGALRVRAHRAYRRLARSLAIAGVTPAILAGHPTTQSS